MLEFKLQRTITTILYNITFGLVYTIIVHCYSRFVYEKARNTQQHSFLFIVFNLNNIDRSKNQEDLRISFLVSEEFIEPCKQWIIQVSKWYTSDFHSHFVVSHSQCIFHEHIVGIPTISAFEQFLNSPVTFSSVPWPLSPFSLFLSISLLLTPFSSPPPSPLYSYSRDWDQVTRYVYCGEEQICVRLSYEIVGK